MNRRLLVPLVLAAALAPLLSGCGAQAQSKTAAADKPKIESVPVEVSAVGQGEITARYAGTASLEAEHEAKLVTEVPGVVLSLAVEEGQAVKKGQILAQLDADRSRLMVRQAEAELDRLKGSDERNERLYARQLIARNAYEQNKSDLATHKAEVELAKLTLSKAAIVAPFDGVVTRRWVKVGQLLKVSDPVFDVADFRDLKAHLRVPEKASVAIKAGQPADFAVDALPGRSYTASVHRIAPVVDAKSGTVEVIVAVDNRDGSLRPGLFCRVDIAYDTVLAATLLPKAAVMTETDGSSVFVIQDGKAHRVPVKLGYESGNNVQALAGVAPGARVITAGQSALTEGTPVQEINAQAVVATTQG